MGDEEILYSRLWCPLFGHLSDIFPPLNSQPSRCLDIIKRARIIWDSYSLDFYHPIAHTSWPEPGQVLDYPKNLLESARSIFMARHSIFQNIMVMDPAKDYYRTSDGRLKETYTPKDRADLLSYFGNCDSAYGKVVDDLPDYYFFAILALGMAWDSISDLIDDSKTEDDPSLVEDIQNATELIALAESTIDKDEIYAAKAYIKKLEPLAEMKQKILAGASKAGKSTKEKIIEKRKPYWDQWKSEADDIWNNKPTLSKLSVATIIAKKLGSEHKIRTIRSHIKRPSP